MKKTNYEEIKSMSMDRMAKNMMLQVACTGGEFPCQMICNGDCKAMGNGECMDIIKEWLMKEAK